MNIIGCIVVVGFFIFSAYVFFEASKPVDTKRLEQILDDALDSLETSEAKEKKEKGNSKSSNGGSCSCSSSRHRNTV
ncbi:MAG: hypothetical protein IKW58_00935 [Alphaproteobacteria bacterium]|nr:hypothetical protein [Alphaproteobacteria bacterium]